MISLVLYLTMLSSLLLNRVGLGLETLVAVGVLILIGAIIIMVIGTLLFFLPAAVIAGVVWFLTASEVYAALAFLGVALLSLARKR